MRGTARWKWVVLAAALPTSIVAASGCHSTPARGSAAASEPALSAPVEPGAKVIEAPATVGTTSTSWMDRHPLFTKPREYYDTTQGGKVGKTAVATVIGVPVGLFGELKQIVTGTPPATKY